MENSSNEQFVETEFGTRVLNKQNKNKTIVVPKIALENCGAKDASEMNVSLVQVIGGEKFIKLTPKKTKQVSINVEEKNESS